MQGESVHELVLFSKIFLLRFTQSLILIARYVEFCPPSIHASFSLGQFLLLASCFFSQQWFRLEAKSTAVCFIIVIFCMHTGEPLAI